MSGKTIFFILFAIVFVATIYTLVKEEKKEDSDYPLVLEGENIVKDEVEALLEGTIDLTEHGGEEGVVLNNPEDNTKERALNCREYLELINKDFYPGNTYEITMDGHAARQCKPLEFLKEANTSKESYLREIDLEEEAYNLCDVVMEEENKHDCQGNYVEKEGPYKITFFDEENNRRTNILQVEIVAWGDVDGDGVEDALVSIWYNAVEGTLRYSQFKKITKLEEGGNFLKLN